MQATIKRWFAEPSHDIRTERTTITLCTDTVTVAVTFPAKLSRREALNRLHAQLAREGCYSPDFLHQLGRLK